MRLKFWIPKNQRLPKAKIQEARVHISHIHDRVVIFTLYYCGLSVTKEVIYNETLSDSAQNLGDAAVEALRQFEVVSPKFYTENLRNRVGPDIRKLTGLKTIKLFERDFVALSIENLLSQTEQGISEKHQWVTLTAPASHKDHIIMRKNCRLDSGEIPEALRALYNNYVNAFQPFFGKHNESRWEK